MSRGGHRALVGMDTLPLPTWDRISWVAPVRPKESLLLSLSISELQVLDLCSESKRKSCHNSVKAEDMK